MRKGMRRANVRNLANLKAFIATSSFDRNAIRTKGSFRSRTSPIPRPFAFRKSSFARRMMIPMDVRSGDDFCGLHLAV